MTAQDPASHATATRLQLLQAVADLVYGPAFHAAEHDREVALEQALAEALGSARRLQLLLDFVQSPRYVRQIEPDLQQLIDDGYVRIHNEQVYRVAAEERRASR